MKRNRKVVVNDIVMISLAVLSVLFLFYEVIVNVSLEQKKYIHYIDITIAAIFLGDFFIHFIKAKDKKFFFKHRWWELLAAIPITTETTQALRAFKIARALPLIEGLRIIRVFVRIKMLMQNSKKLVKYNYLIYIATLVAVVILLGAFWFVFFETGVNPNVTSFGDGIWWAVVTITTVGYGDIHPITTGGRVVAGFLMISGIGVLGAFIAAFNSLIIRKK